LFVCVPATGASSFTEHTGWFAALSGIGLVTSFSSTLMFTALGSFFNRISDPGELGPGVASVVNKCDNISCYFLSTHCLPA